MVIRKALYGLPTSPRDIGMASLRSSGRDSCFATKSDDALRFARPLVDNEFGEIMGVLIVYVDDLAFFGPSGLCQEFTRTVQSHGKTSDPEWLGSKPAHPTGFRLPGVPMCFPSGVPRYNVEALSSVPI